MPSLPLQSEPLVDDAELVRRIANHDEAAFECIMRRNNGALYRVARAILKNTADAEDVLQESYLSAYRHITDFRAEAKLSTWLTRIVVNQALARRRSRHRARIVVPLSQLHADQNLANLKTLKGTAFDKAYVDHEVAYHEQVLDAMDKVLIPNAQSAELRPC